jgi:PAS domain-containing protein
VALKAAAALGLPALAGMLVGTDDGFFVVDERDRFTYANPAACQMLGRSLESLVAVTAVLGNLLRDTGTWSPLPKWNSLLSLHRRREGLCG